ncbi:hypothetical protein HY992_04515, partial [Candidatus Micrarchaeota archaeon]|nr:hypothetical protein [Candidatus Micrarchaeota archaeon]
MHIELRMLGGNAKYYLAYSYRKDGKVRKARVYIGSNLSKRELDEKKKSAEEKIRKKIESIKLIRDPFH